MADWVTVRQVDEDGEEYSKKIQEAKPYNGGRSKAKVIKCGHIIQVYEYENPVILPSLGGKKGKGGRKKEGEKIIEERSEEYRKQSTRKARNKVRTMAIANFNENDLFITLTFSDNRFVETKWGIVEFERFNQTDIKNVDETNKEFKKFIQRLREKFGKNFRYIAVIEFQDMNRRGAVHYHMLADIKGMTQETLFNLWGLGFVDIKNIKQVDNVGAYISYYMTKENEDERLQGKKSYLISRNLKKPIDLHLEEAYEEINGLESGGAVPVYTNEYDSEFCGRVKFKEYNLKRQGGTYN